MDWINDIVLCNHNQTGKSFNRSAYHHRPHKLQWFPRPRMAQSRHGILTPPQAPSRRESGVHSDYVRCLAHWYVLALSWHGPLTKRSREQNWIASGSFDRTIKLWDLGRSSNPDPLITLNPGVATTPKSSVYAIAADPYGHSIASGSPRTCCSIMGPPFW